MSPTPDAVFTPSVRVRGALALVAGRDENAAVYRRFGSRLSADGYTVGVFARPDASSAAAWLAEQGDEPRVLVGSDTGAAAVLSSLARGDVADAAIVAGIAVDVERTPTDAERTACPVHLGVLAEQKAAPSAPEPGPRAPEAPGGAERRSVWGVGIEGPSLPAPADLAAIAVPVLAVHGGADPVSPFETARTVLSAIPDVEVVETVGGLHDALNDATHRSVAASIVLWLERLRSGDVHAPIVRSAAAVPGEEVAA